MILFWRSFLWSLSAMLAVRFLLSALDAPAAIAQDIEVGEGAEIEYDPHLYWKCWRTGGSGNGFSQKEFWDIGNFGSISSTPYLPSLTADRTDDRGLRLSKPKDGTGWKRTRADLIDGRFYRSSGLVTRSGASTGATAPGSAPLIASADQDVLFDPNPDALLPHWNPFLTEADARIQNIDIE